MQGFEEIIGMLLLRNNCVIIPDFGGFVAKKNPAQIDYQKGVMQAPYKSLLFNKQLINNDGLLISSYAFQNKCTFEEASTASKEKIKEWNTILHAGGRINFDKVGFLFFDQERNVCFEQDKNYNLLLQSYGLGNVHFLTKDDVQIIQAKSQKAIEKPTLTVVPKVEQTPNEKVLAFEKVDVIEDEKPIVQTSEQAKENQPIAVVSRKTNFWKYAVAACLLPILFYAFWIPMKTNVLQSKMISLQDFNPFHQQEEAVYEPKSVKQLDQQESNVSLQEQIKDLDESNKKYSYNLTNDTYIQVDLKESKTVKSTKEVVNQVGVAQFDYIVGCFANEENATDLVSLLVSKGFQANIKDVKNGLSRVSIGSATTRTNLNDVIQQSKSAGYLGWVLNSNK